ncbi:glucosamine-6-phosphate deaminase [Geomicrobium sp. JCM 19039]|uniref:glucosamine-6-phosphate deaminase n=1 Tax=Geomicrobium sp. JCM 19039 TaxID=1460636 RepID=UPI00045F12F4|nr:glucosamine-6-phosphate deaminase [Geomicrobium sp. JCM 19039]GAK14063.1 glucosamine-6-phosphate deaminase [Geomicrobium sp. JCM 19039]
MVEVLKEGKIEKLAFAVCSDRDTMGKKAAIHAAEYIKQLQQTKKEIRIIFASAPSQDTFLAYLTRDEAIDWTKIVGFHMDEYIGLPADSDQWFKSYLQSHLTTQVQFKQFHFINGGVDPSAEIKRYQTLLGEEAIDLVCMGVGENGHIAFNDPPIADFHDSEAVRKVELDSVSRQQQVNDGCFPRIQAVPTHAVTLTIPTLLSGAKIVCTVPGSPKKEAVKKMLNGPIHASCPASILRTHDDATLFVDSEAFGG